MSEVKITINAVDLVAAINNLAAALDGKNTKPVSKVGAPGASAPVTQPTVPAVSVNPISAPATQQTAVPVTIPPTANQAAAPVAPTVPVAANPVPASAIPTSAPQYTLEMIATAGSALIDAGKMDQLMQLLGKFGVASLTELAPANYGAVANELRALGAAI